MRQNLPTSQNFSQPLGAQPLRDSRLKAREILSAKRNLSQAMEFSLPSSLCRTTERPSPRAESDSGSIEILRGGVGKPTAPPVCSGGERRKGIPTTARLDFLRGIRLRPGRGASRWLSAERPLEEGDFAS